MKIDGDHKDILKALECCSNSEIEYCPSCPFYHNGYMCLQLSSLAFSFIKELLAENDGLTVEIECLKEREQFLKK